MKRFAIRVVAALALTFTLPNSACDDEGDGVCDKYCKAGTHEANECLDEFFDCEIDEDEYSGYVDECVENCNDAMAELSGDEQSEWKACVNCVISEVGLEPDCDDIGEAIFDDCEDVCEEDGIEEFFEEFEPAEVDEDDIDC